MSLKKEIKNKVKSIIDDPFEVIDITYIPKIDNPKLTFGNTGLRFKSTTLFIDMRGSTKLLNIHQKRTVAKIHMSYFHTIVKIANANDGHVRSFNGDSALIFFQGTTKDTLSNAVITAMKIQYMLVYEVNTIVKKYAEVDFGIGIDHGEVLCTKVGIGGENNRDLFWVGNCVNKATIIGDKCSSPDYIGISSEVYNNLADQAKYGNSWGHNEKVDMWTQESFKYNEKWEAYYYTHWHSIVD